MVRAAQNGYHGYVPGEIAAGVVSEQPTPLEGDLAEALRVSVGRLHRRLRSQRPDDGLGLTPFAVLTTLERHGPLSPSTLAEHEKVRPPSMTKVVAALESRGLVERRPHPSDRRQVVIALALAGRSLLEEDRRRRQAWLRCRLADLSEGDREALRAAVPILEALVSS